MMTRAKGTSEAKRCPAAQVSIRSYAQHLGLGSSLAEPQNEWSHSPGP